MYMIYVIVITIVLLGLAKRGRGRKMGKYIRGRVDEELTMTTLAAKTLVSTIFASTVNERTLVSSIVARWSLRDFTPGSMDGPIMVGVAHSDYSDSEIEEVIENTGTWNEGDLVSQEIGARKVRIIGIFENPSDASDAVVLNDGKPIKTKLNWILLQAQSLRLWGYNLGSSAFATTAPVTQCEGHANLWPR